MKIDAVAKTIETYDSTADDFFNEHSDIAEIKYIADLFVEHLKGKKILDVGCGPGRDAKYFSEHGLDVTGIDAAQNFIKIASKNAPRAKFIKMDLQNLDFSKSSFDGLWVCASFLHVPKKDAKAVLLGFQRVLKPNGLLYLSVKQGNEEKILEKEAYRGGIKFFAFYGENELKNLISSCGFKVFMVVVDKKSDTWINIFANKK